MAYSTDRDLEMFTSSTDSLPLPMKKYHDKAEEKIVEVLLDQGVTQDAIDDADAATLNRLIDPSCHYVLYLFYGGFARDEATLKRAKHHLEQYEKTLSTVKIVDSSGAEEIPQSGKLALG